MQTSELDLLLDLHRRQYRQGPGSDSHTLLALEMTGLQNAADLQLADIGCGTGASTLALAGALGAEVTAVDLLPGFLEELANRAAASELAGRIHPTVADMNALPFADAEFDLLWSEGAIYAMGFENGIASWRRFLKPAGVLAVSEITWLNTERPQEIEAFWTAHYPEIDTPAAKLQALQRQGYAPIGYFTLPESCWLDAYYRPLAAGFDGFLGRHQHSAAATALVEEHRREQALYENYRDQFSYGFYLARKCR